jgi:hypothetical protein
MVTGLGNEMVPWLALVVLVFVVIGASTYILLPAEDTRRHYLVISPLMGFVFMPVCLNYPTSVITADEPWSADLYPVFSSHSSSLSGALLANVTMQ